MYAITSWQVATNHTDEHGVVQQLDEVTSVRLRHHLVALHAGDELE